MIVTRAVVLAAGRGKRLREQDPTAVLDPAQAGAATLGLATMMPIGATGRPFLDYVLSGLADAGFTEACLVLGPDHDQVRARYGPYGPARPSRLRLMYAVQPKATGPGDAILAAEPLLAGAPFVVLEGDRYYPVAVLRQLRDLPIPGLPAFRAGTLVDAGLPAERFAGQSRLEVGEKGALIGIKEPPEGVPLDPDARVALGLWLFDKEIFRACKEVPLSRRNERELPEAVHWAMARHGATYHTFPADGPVRELTRRADVAGVSAALGSVEVVV